MEHIKVLQRTRSAGNYMWYALCKCHCGVIFEAREANVKNGHTKSCGCTQYDKKHGHTTLTWQSPTYNSWCRIKQRCLNPDSPAYKYYGGRGIMVCERWMIFENFLADMGERPKGTTIDRINNDGHYELSNCRWATMKIQCSNKRQRGSIFKDGEIWLIKRLLKVGVKQKVIAAMFKTSQPTISIIKLKRRLCYG